MGDGLVQVPLEVILLAFIIVTVIFIILLLVLWRKLTKLRRMYQTMLNGEGEINVEQVLIGLQTQYNEMVDRQTATEQAIQFMQDKMKRMKSHIAVHRYNAFSETGSDLSFSVAIVDEQQDGVVLTGIHNRDTTYVYAKPLSQGQSKYTLSPEERETISQSLQHKKSSENG